LEFATIKGFKDILPDDVETWQRLESEARRVFHAFGFREIRPPLLERTELFSRGIGQETDIVSKEMYTLTDSKGRGITLRPEATASVVRAYVQNRLYLKNPIQKLFNIGPMFRHERPQKGRFRQFHQIDAEIFGDPGSRSDADIIIMAMFFLEMIGLSDLSLHINSLGCHKCRVKFKKELKKYLIQKIHALCSDCQRRTETNPLRVFDCKVDTCKETVSVAPSILDYICEECQTHFESVQGYLEGSDVPFVLNHKLVRGLDYYTRTTIEIQTDRLGAQNAVTGGGRYDGLVKLLGGPDHPGTGFAIGIERLVALLDEDVKQEIRRPDLFIAALGDTVEKKAFNWANDLRRTGIWVETEYSTKGLKAQMKRAGRLGARWVLMIGDDELASGKGILRDMEKKVQEEVAINGIVKNLNGILMESKE
jgi:histidyl-tRNA synthetase